MERCCSAVSSASSSAGCAEDRTVMEAAEALADLAHLAMRESAGDSAASWGSKGKRAAKRVSSESPPLDSAFNSVDSNHFDSLARSSDIAEDRAEVDQRQQMICNDTKTKPVKVEQDAESLRRISISATRQTATGGSRSRQNLTEAEKEARRIHRILANRESARQTIRRRQALCEELSRKAAYLTWENENLKKKKELALKDYQSLEETNKQLKAQMAKAIKAEMEENPGELKSAHVEVSASQSMNYPLLLYNQHPFLPLCWPSIQSSNTVQSQYEHQTAAAFPPSTPSQNTCDLKYCMEQKDGVNNSEPITQLYLMPCPWFYPLPDHRNGLHPHSSFGVRHLQDETSLNNQYSSSSTLRTVAHAEHHHFSCPIKVKAETFNSTEARLANDVNEAVFDSPSDKGGEYVGTHHNQMIPRLAPGNSAGPSCTVKHETCHRLYCTPSTGSTSIKAGHDIISFPEKDPELPNHPGKKMTNAHAAAEARKRRKELTKLKNLHSRKCRMHY
ncbi:bZIP_1 domain-containing protein [Cephalotus follicularis]|uniref:BZIP_1 domain-containing protein n=1 Tax=Cephalotus follicularis TaxID=3775 RepID=A0A1Q3BDU1_CEPFO|nr:bZIP_1 domain-containing protein [Cephalotus follicularis]